MRPKAFFDQSLARYLSPADRDMLPAAKNPQFQTVAPELIASFNTQTALQSLLPAWDVDKAMSLIGGKWTGTQDEAKAFFDQSLARYFAPADRDMLAAAKNPQFLTVAAELIPFFNTRTALQSLLPASAVDKAMSLIGGQWTGTLDEAGTFFDQSLALYLERTDREVLVNAKDPQPHFQTVAPELIAFLRESLVRQKLGTALHLDSAMIADLLDNRVTAVGLNTKQSPQKAMEDFLDPDFISKPDAQVTVTAFPNQFGTYLRLEKIAIVITRLHITFNQLTWVFDYAKAGAGWLNLDSIPPLPKDPFIVSSGKGSGGNGSKNSGTAAEVSVQAARDGNLFPAWERLMDLMRLRDSVPGGEITLSQIFQSARTPQDKEPDLLKKLSTSTGWNPDDLTYLAGPEGLNLSHPAAYRDERALARLASCFGMMKRLGLTPQQCRGLTTGDLTTGYLRPSDASIAQQAAKSRYDDSGWLAVAKPLGDLFREQQRAALVSYVMARPDSAKDKNWKDASGLHDYFLIDVEMSPCQMTSRILEAINAVQLFVQRCRMNLEGVPMSADPGWLEWSWMKHYRVWEANRKVFFWPENWIEPELRDNKSPFFKDFENELLQTDVTTDSVETALHGYLEKLDDVARLEMAGLYHQVETDTIHVFGRTRGIPHRYYYRQWVNHSYWTAWEQVKLDIEGDHLIPVEWNGRLCLFWPVFTDKQENMIASTGKKPPITSKTTITAPENPENKGTWQEFTMDWSSGDSSCLDIEIVDTCTDPVGNDFGIAELTFFAKGTEGPNLLVNGFFLEDRKDRLGFSTDYKIGGSPDQGSLWITSNASKANPAWEGKRSGPFLAVDGATISGKTVWRQHVDVKRNTDYQFHGYVGNLYISSIATLEFRFIGTSGTDPISDKTPQQNRLEIQLAWSEYKHNKWQSKRVSQNRVMVAPNCGIYPPPRDSFYFKALFVQEELVIRAYESCVSFDGRAHAVLDASGPDHCPVGEFRFTGCKGEPVVTDPAVGAPPLRWPPNTAPDSMKRVEINSSTALIPGDNRWFTNDQRSLVGTLDHSSGLFRLLPPHQEDPQFASQRPFFFEDDFRTYFVIPEWVTPFVGFDGGLPLAKVEWVGIQLPLAPPTAAVATLAAPEPQQFSTSALAPVAGDISVTQGLAPFQSAYELFQSREYRFVNFYHPYVCLFIWQLNRNGIDGLFKRLLQTQPEEVHPKVPKGTPFRFETAYLPEPTTVDKRYPMQDVDFSYGGSYSLYNWELFFHIPLLIANRLSLNQRFEDAQKWYHYIFDPTEASTSSDPAPQCFWRTAPFNKALAADFQAEQLQNLLRSLAAGTPDPELHAQIREWRSNPFSPHLIARMRRTTYPKTVVMKYIDNLIAWGDQLFRQDTIESINEATQLYLMAAGILGRRPEKIPARITVLAQCYNDIAPRLDDLSNALVKVENLGTVLQQNGQPSSFKQRVPELSPLYFCVPKNDKLLGYWDTVADRLFKIRHCMNIEGVVQKLALFEPPIDPGLLVKAAAAGIDLGSALSDLNGPLPPCRFNVTSQKAAELCSEVKALGAALLSAREKRDAEGLSRLRSTQEITLLNAVRQLKEQQIEEATASLEGLKKSREMAVIRRDYYNGLSFMNAWEIAHLDLTARSLVLQTVGEGVQTSAAIAHLIPNFKAAMPTSLGVIFGGENVGKAADAAASVLRMFANILSTSASMSATMGSYQRRSEEWKLQANLAAKEIEQADQNILAAQIRTAVAEMELRNHDVQIQNATDTDTFMRDKFTNQELYDWMVSQISSIYFQSYQLAYDVAKRAERSFKYELSLDDSSFIQFGYWDSLKKGLLSGERLYHDIQRMEVAYLDQNRREYEITKHISLLLTDPLQLISLRETGKCSLTLPEALFDADYPGHYMRRVKSMGITIPCVTGPYTSVNCTLTLGNSRIRKNPDVGSEYAENSNASDLRFRYQIGAVESIATSGAQNDSGLFELNFRDERYLPFEGRGVISTWQIDLPRESNQFDFNTISDVVLHLKYTARDGGEILKKNATPVSPQSGFRLFSAKHEFPSEWHHFLNPSETEDQSMALNLTAERFPMQKPGWKIKIAALDLYLSVNDNKAYQSGTPLTITVTPPGTTKPPKQLISADQDAGGLPHLAISYSPEKVPGMWTLGVAETDVGNLEATFWKEVTAANGDRRNRLNADAIQDLWIACRYTMSDN